MTDERALKIALDALHEKRRGVGHMGVSYGELIDAIHIVEGLHAEKKGEA